MHGRISRLGLIGVVGVSSAVGVTCVNPFGLDCTLIGCESGLLVELDGEVTYPFTLTAQAGSGEPRVMECAASSCWLMFTDYTPAAVTITYSSEGRVVEQSFEPEWGIFQPNGPRCEPTCHNATVVLDLFD